MLPEGTGYRARTRFAKFFNLPELMTMFKEVADIKTNIPYHKAEEMVREMEDELHARIDDETWNLYLKMSDLAGEAQRMLGEALYLQGAEDREHMLQ